MPSVVVSPYRAEWAACFRDVRQELLSALSEETFFIEHIGSTSVPNLAAKPVIDVLVGARSLAMIEVRVPHLSYLGYEYRPSYELEIPERRYFVKAASVLPRVHVHAVEVESSLWRSHLAFRQALRDDEQLAREYEALKIRLSLEHPNDKELYTLGKGPFIQRVISQALGNVA